MVAYLFVGNETYGMSSLRQTAQTAICQSMAVIDATRKAANVEDTKICLHSDWLNKFETRTIDELIEVSDCRPFAAFLHTSPLKATTKFMNGLDTSSETSQGDTIHHWAVYSTTNSFQAVLHTIVSEMYQCVMRELVEKEKFLTYIRRDNWPTEMKPYRWTCSEALN